MTNPPTILVTGATGTVGREVVAALLADERRAKVRIATRDVAQAAARFGESPTAAEQRPDAAEQSPDAAEHAQATSADSQSGRLEYVHFNFADPATYSAATQGADAVFVLGPPLDLGLDALLRPFVEHLAGLPDVRVVFFSAYGAERIAFMSSLLGAVRERIPGATVLQPGFFSTNFGHYERENIEQRGIVFQAAGQGRTAFIDPSDIGRAAAATLLDDGHAGRTYVLTGPELHSNADIAAMLTEIRGRETRYVAASEKEYRGALAAAGVPGFVADYMLPVYALIAEGHVGEVTDDIERLTGRRPLPVRRALERDFGGR